mgnify:CR=1 FL=1
MTFCDRKVSRIGESSEKKNEKKGELVNVKKQKREEWSEKRRMKNGVNRGKA